MLKVPAGKMSKSFGQYRDAVQREQVIAITSHDRESAFLISPEIYAEYKKLKARMPKSIFIEELSDETVRAIATAKMDARHNHLNSLIEE